MKYTREDIANRIVNHGDLLIIYQQKIYRLNSWIKHHPGGELIILHMIGKDATDEINAYHSDSILIKKLPLFYFGEIDPNEFFSLNSPIDFYSENHDVNNNRLLTPEFLLASKSSNHQRITHAYRQLYHKLHFLGLFDCNYFDYLREICRYSLLAFLSIYFFISANSSSTTWYYYLSAIFLGAFWHQLTFTAHDAGHLAITHSYTIDSWIGIFIGNCLGGISIGWWKYHHNIHHVVTNSPEHDPDIQHLPFFAITPKFFQSIYSTYHQKILSYNCLSSWIIRFQHLTYYLIMCFARFNLQIQSYIYLFKHTRAPFRSMEILCICLYWFWFLLLLNSIPTYTQAVIYFFISYMITMPLHVQITLSHFGMSTDDYGPNESFPSKMLRTTMDIACPSWLDFFHGGLQFQAVHHLFPRMPRHQLRTASIFVQEFANEVGLKYHIYGFVRGNTKVLNVLKDVAMQIQLMKKVVKSNVHSID